MTLEFSGDVFESRSAEILSLIETVKTETVLRIAREIAATNTTIRDLGLEVSEKLDYDYNVDDLVEYLDEIAPGSVFRIRARMNEAVSEYYNQLVSGNPL